MTVIFHPRIRADLREILDYYDDRSDPAGDRFYVEFEATVARIKHMPRQFPLLDELRRRCHFPNIPDHIVYEIDGERILITVLRHHSRHSSFGLRRKWR